MGDGTAIEWTDATWNPIVGCSRISPGCDHCYAIGVAHRGMSEHHRGLTVRPEGGPTDWNGEIHQAPESIFLKPLAWKRPRRIFVNSLSDLFHQEVETELIARIFAVMSLAPQHTFQVLTKRSQRMQDLVDSGRFAGLVDEIREEIDPSCGDVPWPLPNVWLGVSIESNRYAFRARHLSTTPAAVRWVSAEPLLGPLDELSLDGIDWIVAGGESGPGSRPMQMEWVRDLRDRCVRGLECYCVAEGPRYSGSNWTDDPDGSPDECPRCDLGRIPIPFLFKQWGDWAPDYDLETGEQTPESMSRVGKRAAGRELDGRTWDEYPA